MGRYDIVFDFSSSSEGGAIKRINAYIDYFSKSPLKTLFLLHQNMTEQIHLISGVDIKIINKNKLFRAIGITEYLGFLKEKPRWFFSYGMPLNYPVGERNWFHISNTLPLALNSLSINSLNRYRQAILQCQLRARALRCDVVSAESQFALNLYAKITSKKYSEIILKNGISLDPKNFLRSLPETPKFAIAVGTNEYKRIALTIAVYDSIRISDQLEYLIILGDVSEVPKAFLARSDIKIVKKLNPNPYFDLLARAAVFISTSIIENSSNAVLEALALCPKLILSDIPPHQEMLNLKDTQSEEINGVAMLLQDNQRKVSLPIWEDSIAVMLNKMGITDEFNSA